MDSLPPPPNEEELVGDEEEVSGNKIVVKATIESSSESGDDPQTEEGITSHRSSIPSMQEEEDMRSPSNQDNDNDTLNEEPNEIAHVNDKNLHPRSNSSSSESIVDQINEHFDHVLSQRNEENVEARDKDDTHSTKSISSDVMHDAVGDEGSGVNPMEAAEWNNKMANISNSFRSRSISNESIENENENEAIDEIKKTEDSTEMRVTRDTIVSKENVKIEVTRQRKKTLPNSDEYYDEPNNVNPPMPAPRTVTPISEV